MKSNYYDHVNDLNSDIWSAFNDGKYDVLKAFVHVDIHFSQVWVQVLELFPAFSLAKVQHFRKWSYFQSCSYLLTSSQVLHTWIHTLTYFAALTEILIDGSEWQ